MSSGHSQTVRICAPISVPDAEFPTTTTFCLVIVSDGGGRVDPTSIRGRDRLVASNRGAKTTESTELVRGNVGRLEQRSQRSTLAGFKVLNCTSGIG